MAPITIAKDNPSRPTNPATADPSQPHKSVQPMADRDLESIGRHCQFEFCRQLDFLPFRCESCRGTFCLEHRTESAHKCVREGEWARRQQQTPGNGAGLGAGKAEKPSIHNTDQCAHVACKTLVNTLKDPGVTCPDCRGEFCLKHRLREEHDCRRPVGYGQDRRGAQVGSGGGGESLRSMFSRVRTWGKDKSASASTAVATANLPTRAKGKSNSTSPAAINALKKTAKGAASVPPDRRVYLHVVGTADTPKADAPAGEFFYDSRWKVGRVLDDAARRLGVENVNNRGGGEETRLRVFHVENGEFLEFSDGIGERVRSGQTIVLLRGAGVVLGKG
ncbi:Zinc finger protein [Aspergillus sp. HF37]|nr:Zinc finger protein [Aspergillus sp. HF37]